MKDFFKRKFLMILFSPQYTHIIAHYCIERRQSGENGCIAIPQQARKFI